MGPVRKAMNLVGALFLFGLCGFAVLSYWGNSPDTKDTGAVKQVMEGYLVAPSTAKYKEITINERAGGFVRATVVVDAQNTYGAMLRQRLLVIFDWKDSEHFEWSKVDGIQELPSDNAEAIAIYKRLNGWPGAK